GLNGFVGEFLVILGAFQTARPFAIVAALGVILSAVYMLWMFQRVMFGEVTKEENRKLVDLSPREWAVLTPVLILIIWIGVHPKPFLKTSEVAVADILKRYGASQFGQVVTPPVHDISIPGADPSVPPRMEAAR
ncbi:MAG TPA: Fe-S-binding domain-containing protein, partial [Candidatus Eisenbacteria bacterium]